MKFMKLGSKPDAFQTDGNNVRFVASELATDVVVYVGDVKFHLHKFPLLSKSYRLQKFILESNHSEMDEVYINDFPGGPKAFEICAKFCYGMTVTLNAYNVVAARCAAEYLEMSEDVEKGNLIYKIEVFLNSSVFRSWKDSIIVLQTTKALFPWSEELKIVGRCIDSIASKTSVEPSLVNWSYTYSRRLTDQIVELHQEKNQTVPSDWWVEDICELDVDLYKGVIIAIKSKGRMSSELIEEALKAYAVRWLPETYDALVSDDYMKRNRTLVETLIWLLPTDKSSGCSCRFLLKLLKIVVLMEAGDLLKEELMSRISSQLHKATVKDLLIPAKAPCDTIYDIDLVKSLVSRFLVKEGAARDPDTTTECEEQNGEYLLGCASLLSLGKLVDGYLAEIASDPKLRISSFISLSMLLPEVARPAHDGLYTAIDIYLKEHPNLTKAEKKNICGLMDVRKLSTEASIHAAQNDRLPLRVVVQVLFFEQLRTATATARENSHGSARTTANVDEDWGRPAPEHYKSLKRQLKSVKIEENNNNTSNGENCKNKDGGLLLPSRSRRIFDKLWGGKGHGENNRSSDTSGSSQSPPSSSVNPLEASKSSGSSSRRNNQRHSVS